MKQTLIEKFSKNKELPKNMSEVYKSLGYFNYKFNSSDSHINNFTKICMIAKSINGPNWNPEIDKKPKIFFPCFKWFKSFNKFFFFENYINVEIYSNSFNLGFKTIQLAKYAAITFSEEYNEWLKETKKEKKIIQKVDYKKINSMSDVYRINGINNLTTLPDTKERYYEDLILITKAFNGNWRPNYNDSNQHKYFNFFKTKFKFSHNFSIDFYNGKSLNLNPRLVFKDKKRAEYAGKKFFKQYEKFIKFI
jgi:hypothetical protein